METKQTSGQNANQKQQQQPQLAVYHPLQFSEPLANDPNELLEQHFLYRGEFLLLSGQTGIGKSSWDFQAAVLWALGREFCGIRPKWPLKSLIVQAENNDARMYLMWNGIIKGLRLSGPEIERASESIWIHRQLRHTGRPFFSQCLKPLLDLHKPKGLDLLHMDPVLAYLGGDLRQQEQVACFSRENLAPILDDYEIGGLLIHHMPKPLANGRGLKGMDRVYAGAGSIEFQNTAKTTLNLARTSSKELFILEAGKGWEGLGWEEPERYLGHAPDAIYWYETTKDMLEKPKRSDNRQAYVLKVVKDHPKGVTWSEWQAFSQSLYGVKASPFERYRAELERTKAVHQADGKWFPS